MRSIILSVIAAIAIAPSFAEETNQKTIKDLEREEFLLGGTLWERLDRATRKKAIQCMKAFPNQKFCNCLANQIPMIFTISQYTAIVTTSREEIGYDKMSDKEKKAIETTMQARERCANESM